MDSLVYVCSKFYCEKVYRLHILEVFTSNFRTEIRDLPVKCIPTVLFKYEVGYMARKQKTKPKNKKTLMGL